MHLPHWNAMIVLYTLQSVNGVNVQLPFLVSHRDASQLQSFHELESIMSQDADLSQLHITLLPSSDETGPGTWLQLLPPHVSTVQSDVGPVDAVQIIVSDSLIYQVQLLFPIIRTAETGFLKLESTNLKTMLWTFLSSSSYAFCPGLPKKDYATICLQSSAMIQSIWGNQMWGIRNELMSTPAMFGFIPLLLILYRQTSPWPAPCPMQATLQTYERGSSVCYFGITSRKKQEGFNQNLISPLHSCHQSARSWGNSSSAERNTHWPKH